MKVYYMKDNYTILYVYRIMYVYDKIYIIEICKL